MKDRRIKKRPVAEFRSGREPTWCPGCTYYGVLTALTRAFSRMRIAPNAVTVVSGIGCSSRLPLWLSTFGMHTLHGRALPVAVGARLARPEVPVVVTSGDGDLFSIGVGHFVHAARRNVDLTVICLNNRLYAMTKNQASPTSARGYRGTLTPLGTASSPLNTVELAISCGATFVGRTFAGDLAHMQRIIGQGLRHRGFAFVDVLAPCKSFDPAHDIPFYRPRIVDIVAQGHHAHDRAQALAQAARVYAGDIDESRPVPVGVFWECPGMPIYEEKRAAAPAGARRVADVLRSTLDECNPDR